MRHAFEGAGSVLTTTGRSGYLPGELALDRDLLDRAVAGINAIAIRHGLEMACALGQFVLDTFFDGSITHFRSRERKHTTLRALARRPDLHVAYNTVWYSVAVLDQLDELPQTVAHALPLTHHKLLLPVDDRPLKRELALRAVREGLSSRQFAEIVRRARAARGARAPGGRPPLPAVLKGVTRLKRALALATSEVIDARTLARMESEDVQQLTAELDRQIAALTTLKQRVSQVAAALEPAARSRA